MYPDVRAYSDPFEGLKAQLTPLRGLIKIVPPLIDEERQRRYEAIGARPGSPDDPDMIEIYESEAGPEEGYGHADYARTIYFAAVITAWTTFQDYLARQLEVNYLRYDLSDHPLLATLVKDETRDWDYRFDKIVQRYRDFAGIRLKKVTGWDHVQHARELRNALVHNQGLYTSNYLATRFAFRLTKDDLLGAPPPPDDADWIDEEAIPLSYARVDQVIGQLIEVGAEVRAAIRKA